MSVATMAYGAMAYGVAFVFVVLFALWAYNLPIVSASERRVAAKCVVLAPVWPVLVVYAVWLAVAPPVREGVAALRGRS